MVTARSISLDVPSVSTIRHIRGTHHETAHSACAIVANNRFDGYLSFGTTPGSPPIDVAPDGLLTRQDYYFHVPDCFKYPIVPSFRHWQYPHGRIPESWETCMRPSNEPSSVSGTPTDLTSAVKYRDTTCRITQSAEALQVAHLCPQSEKNWFIDNDMTIYRPPILLPPPNFPSNALLLRADLHHVFDQKRFCFVPKCRVLVICVLIDSPELLRLYHNTMLHDLSAVSPHYLFVRFAWSVFSMLSLSFLSAEVSRDIVVLNDQEQQSRLDVSYNEICEIAALRGQSRSPKKRSRRLRANEEQRDKQESSMNHHPRLNQRGRQRATRAIWNTEHNVRQVPGPDEPLRPQQLRSRKRDCDEENVAETEPKRIRTANPETQPSSLIRSQPRETTYLQPSPTTEQPLKTDTHSASSVNSPLDNMPPPASPNSLPRSWKTPNTIPPPHNDSDELTALRKQGLHQERLRSDPAGAWAAEQQWVLDEIGRPQSPRSIKRLLRGLGAEIEGD